MDAWRLTLLLRPPLTKGRQMLPCGHFTPLQPFTHNPLCYPQCHSALTTPPHHSTEVDPVSAGVVQHPLPALWPGERGCPTISWSRGQCEQGAGSAGIGHGRQGARVPGFPPVLMTASTSLFQKTLLSLRGTLNTTESNFHHLVALLNCRGLHKVRPPPSLSP